MGGFLSFLWIKKYAGCGVCMLSHVWLFAAPLFMRFSRQEHWSGLPFPPPGEIPDPGIKFAFLASPALVSGFFTISATSSIQFSCSVVSDSFRPTSTTIHIQNRVHRVTKSHTRLKWLSTHIPSRQWFHFFQIYTQNDCLDHMEALFLIFWKTSILFSIMIVTTYNLTNSA